MAVALIGASPKETIREVARNHGYDSLKEEQLLAIEKFVTGSDVFVSLPTGFGKSLIYGLLPSVFDRLKGYLEPTSASKLVLTSSVPTRGSASLLCQSCSAM